MSTKNYYLWVSYIGYDQSLDIEIEKIIKKKYTESGYYFLQQKREICFWFKSEQAAKNAQNRLSRLTTKTKLQSKILKGNE